MRRKTKGNSTQSKRNTYTKTLASKATCSKSNRRLNDSHKVEVRGTGPGRKKNTI